jgi:hypothetical protein
MVYNVGGGDDGDDDDDDEEGSRAIPSGTFIGTRSAFTEKYPWAIKPRFTIFGWVDAYIYRCVLSNAKIELMSTDLPQIKYAKHKEKDASGNVVKTKFKPEDFSEVDALNKAAAERARLKHESGVQEQKVSMSALLSGEIKL